jgi:hypothetical protein
MRHDLKSFVLNANVLAQTSGNSLWLVLLAAVAPGVLPDASDQRL